MRERSVESVCSVESVILWFFWLASLRARLAEIDARYSRPKILGSSMRTEPVNGVSAVSAVSAASDLLSTFIHQGILNGVE